MVHQASLKAGRDQQDFVYMKGQGERNHRHSVWAGHLRYIRRSNLRKTDFRLSFSGVRMHAAMLRLSQKGLSRPQQTHAKQRNAQQAAVYRTWQHKPQGFGRYEMGCGTEEQTLAADLASRPASASRTSAQRILHQHSIAPDTCNVTPGLTSHWWTPPKNGPTARKTPASVFCTRPKKGLVFLSHEVP